MKYNIKIEKLDPEDTESILKIAGWYFKEWETSIEKTIDRLTSQPNNNTLIQLVAILNNELVATGGLCNNVSIYKKHKKLKKYKPWIGLLYTSKDYRNKGIGSMVLENLEQHAKDLNLETIYLYTFTAESFYKRSGWAEIDTVRYKEHNTAVMMKNL